MAIWSQPSLFETHLNRRIDSEFFGPAYIEAEYRTRQGSTDDLGNLGAFVPGPFGSAFHVKDYDFTSSYRYIRGRDVKRFFLLDDDNRFVPEVDFYRLQKYAVGPNDLMISVVGTLGNVSICTINDTPAIFSCKSTLFRARTIDPYYLLVFLNCKYGALCLLRRQRGAVQTGLNIEDLRTVPVPRFESVVEAEIANDIRSAYKALHDSKKSYTEAQQLLESELGLDKLLFQKPVGYTAQFSEAITGGRIDADYFQPQYTAVRELIQSYSGGHEALLNCADSLPPNIDPLKTPKSLFNYIELSNINASLGIVEGFQPSLGADLPSRAKRQVQTADVIASAVVGSIDKVAIISERQNGFLASTGFFHLRPKSISTEYLLMLVRSQCVRMQFQQQSTGGILSAVPDSRLKHIIVPKIPISIQQKIASLVAASHSAKHKSDNLLAQAKTRVEQLIEEAAKS